MNIQVPEKNNTIDKNPSIDEVGKMFDNLFLDPSKKDLCIKLFEWIPWITREQAVNQAISASKKWLSNLKTETITI